MKKQLTFQTSFSKGDLRKFVKYRTWCGVRRTVDLGTLSPLARFLAEHLKAITSSKFVPVHIYVYSDKPDAYHVRARGGSEAYIQAYGLESEYTPIDWARNIPHYYDSRLKGGVTGQNKGNTPARHLERIASEILAMGVDRIEIVSATSRHVFTVGERESPNESR